MWLCARDSLTRQDFDDNSQKYVKITNYMKVITLYVLVAAYALVNEWYGWEGSYMREYVVAQYPPELHKEIVEINLRIQTLWIEGKFGEAEKLFEEWCNLIRSYEDKLPEGQRYHKGTPLHNWGIAILLQKGDYVSNYT